MQLPDESCFDSEHPMNSIVREARRQYTKMTTKAADAVGYNVVLADPSSV